MNQTQDTSNALDRAGRDLATWRLRPAPAWLAALVVSLGGVLLTALGAAFAQVRGLDEIASVYLLAGFVAASAALGLVVMLRTRRPLSHYGFRGPQQLSQIWWAIPIFVIPIVVWATTPPTVPTAAYPAYALLTVAVGFNEEIWFRGLAQAALRRFGHRTAIIGAAVFFGVLHLGNALGGKSPLYLALQVVLAFLVGLVFGEIVAITGSLWPCIAWHFVYDFSAYLGGDSLGTAALAGIAVIDVILVGYAVALWRRLAR